MTATNSSRADDHVSFSVHESVSAVTDKYDGFILDQFGVLHNGVTGLEGASECVHQLKQRGKKCIILSNSSSLASSTVDRLSKFDLNADDFVGAVTSGEEAALHVRERYPNKRALFLTWATPKQPSPALFVQHCGNVPVTDKVSEADFVLLHGCEVVRGPGPDGQATETSLGDFMKSGDIESVIEPLLKQCHERKLPMVCANPDFKIVYPDGSTGSMPGVIAKAYEAMGGSVTSFGKPHKEHFEACIRDLQLPRNKIVHVGDSLHHDIAGANETGIASIFVVGGVHREELDEECELGKLPSRESLVRLFSKHRQTPTHVVPMLKF